MISTWRRNRRTHTVGVFVAGLTALGLAACSGSPSTTGTGSRQGGPAAPNPNPGVGAPGAPASAGAGAPGADSRGVASPAPTSRPTSTRDFSMTDPAKDRLSTFALDIDDMELISKRMLICEEVTLVIIPKGASGAAS